jgi:histidyl-tRNA synthetase
MRKLEWFEGDRNGYRYPSGVEYRAIIRFSLDGDSASRETLTNNTRKSLEAIGFKKIGTGSYENTNLNATDVGTFLDVVKQIANCHGIGGGLNSVDHLWFYLDTIS